MGSSEDPSLVNNVDELGLVYWGLNQQWYLQISGFGDRPAGRDERLECRRVCDGESGREALAESAATCRASSSARVVKTPDEDTRATQGGGVTSAILSAIWATSS